MHDTIYTQLAKTTLDYIFDLTAEMYLPLFLDILLCVCVLHDDDDCQEYPGTKPDFFGYTRVQVPGYPQRIHPTKHTLKQSIANGGTKKLVVSVILGYRYPGHPQGIHPTNHTHSSLFMEIQNNWLFRLYSGIGTRVSAEYTLLL